MESIYTDRTYLEHNPTWHQEDSPWKAAKIQALLRRNGVALTEVCEIGCGAGEILNQLYKTSPQTSRFYGYELSEIAYQLCLPKSKDRLTFYHSDPLTTANRVFDVALIIDVFEHVQDFIGFIKDVKHLATFKVFHIPLELSAQSVIRSSPLLGSRHRLGHLHFFTKDLALDSLRQAGYDIVDYCYTNAAFDLPKKLRTKLLNLPRRVLYSISPDICSRILGGFSLLVLAR